MRRVIQAVVAGIILHMLFGIEATVRFIYDVFTTGLPVWMIAILLSTIAIVPIYMRGKKARSKPSIKTRPIYTEYDSDIFDDVLYRWEYIETDGQYRIGRIKQYCPKCIFLLVGGDCDKCRRSYYEVKSRAQIEALIRFNVEEKYKVNEFQSIRESNDNER